jgi:NAD(P)-dependent dehydrogenase (short-subunit alcohol dehydrogenase family)
MPDQVKYTQKWEGKHVLVFGGSSGIGYGVAEAAVEHGARVTISSSTRARLDNAVQRLKTSYPSASQNIATILCNLADGDKLEENVQALFEEVGKVDHIVHTAGDALMAKPLAEETLPQMLQTGMVRFFAPLIIAKHAPKYLTGGPESSITLTTGIAGERPVPHWTVISAYLGGLEAMTRSLALNLKPIRVNIVSLGAIKTELWNNVPEQVREKILKAHEAAVPTGKVGRVQDAAEAYIYAMKDQNITGSTIETNGGQLLLGMNDHRDVLGD